MTIPADDFMFDDGGGAPFRPSKDIDINRIMDLDHRIMKAMYMRTIDDAAQDIMKILEEFTRQEICALICRLIGATYYPQYMAVIAAERFNWSMRNDARKDRKKDGDKGLQNGPPAV